jgi:Serine/Threonine/Tyrosine Kinase found in polyvalent proteins
MPIKYELQNIISKNGFVRNGEVIQTITDYLRTEKKAVSNPKESKLSKVQETEALKRFIVRYNLWYLAIDDSKYIGEGAEQKIYEFSDPHFVLKLNDVFLVKNTYKGSDQLFLHIILYISETFLLWM